jgi:hypothetical protein
MATNKTRTVIYLLPSDRERLDDLATKRGTATTELARQAIVAWLDAQEIKEKPGVEVSAKYVKRLVTEFMRQEQARKPQGRK